jgi:hypothetical protein
MRKAIVSLELPPAVRTLVVEVQDPGIVRGFLTGIRQKPVLVGNGNQVVEEVPTLLVEVDPDAPKRKRSFLIVDTNEVIENSSGLVFVTYITSRTGKVYHLFENTNYLPDL